MNIIHLNDALADMKKPEPFSLSYVTCDQHRHTGGEIISLGKVLLSHNENMAKELDFVAPEKGISGRTRRPRHREHATRNVILPNGKIRKFHIRLMLQFNGKKVFY